MAHFNKILVGGKTLIVVYQNGHTICHKFLRNFSDLYMYMTDEFLNRSKT